MTFLATIKQENGASYEKTFDNKLSAREWINQIQSEIKKTHYCIIAMGEDLTYRSIREDLLTEEQIKIRKNRKLIEYIKWISRDYGVSYWWETKIIRV